MKKELIELYWASEQKKDQLWAIANKIEKSKKQGKNIDSLVKTFYEISKELKKIEAEMTLIEYGKK